MLHLRSHLFTWDWQYENYSKMTDFSGFHLKTAKLGVTITLHYMWYINDILFY